MCAIHGLLGKSGCDVQVCVTGRGERCERTSEDHGVLSAGQSLLPSDLPLLFSPPPPNPRPPWILVFSHPSARRIATTHTA